MAEKQATPSSELETYAFELFKQNPNRSADSAFRRAESFMATRDRIRSGEPESKAGGFDNCYAPNLPVTHPVNLVSQKAGDQQVINLVTRFLRDNPPVAIAEEEERLIGRFRQKFPTLMTVDNNRSVVPWDLPTINTARVILPEYATN